MTYREYIVRYNSKPYTVTESMLEKQRQKVELLKGRVKEARGLQESKLQRELSEEMQILGFLRRTRDAQQYATSTGKQKDMYPSWDEQTNDSVYGKYEYVSAGQPHRTDDAQMAARYNAQDRYFAMNAPRKALAKVFGQWRKFDKLWDGAEYGSAEREEQAKALNKMFR